ncbi:hypothetical protein CHS0354_031820 [Potamilus streckersoni]|uniref:Uncharacterized protein n=1 Tax=Potamilus streckersoni TaxID=2493646 RepID=A0AAE0RXI6_9BIVA|nr:hypothetical protein CHS0354_031820 [Potamilus streckersoni]
MSTISTVTQASCRHHREVELLLNFAIRNYTLPNNNPPKTAFQKCNIRFIPKRVPKPRPEQRLHLDATPWRTKDLHINLSLTTMGSKRHKPWKLLTAINIIMESQYPQHIEIYTDGYTLSESDRKASAVGIQKFHYRLEDRLRYGCSIYTGDIRAIHQALNWIRNHMQQAHHHHP